MSHWAFNYLNISWESGALGPDKYDCWTFFRMVQANHYGIDVPIIGDVANQLVLLRRLFRKHTERNNWVPVKEPKDGDAVLMFKGKYEDHVGVFLDIDGGRVLHCAQGFGVICNSVNQMDIAGWNRLEYYRRVDESVS